MIQSIPLNKLVRSSRNVRRSSDAHADFQLKADIEARGLLQNLVVTSIAKPRGSFAVEAGDRRLRALQQLAAEGRIPKSHEVCCLVIDDDPAQVRETSLAENFQHLRMNPADECLAFRQLLEQGADIEGIARRFGLTMRFVEGRLRLASLAPVVFEALGAGDISLEVAKAYAVTADQERQAQVFEQMGRGYGYAHPDSIRRLMTQATASGDDRRARFVGEEAYVAAGGRIERDLFADDSSAQWLDVALLEQLAAAKLAELAAAKQQELGLAFVRPSLDSWIGQAQLEGLERLVLEPVPLSDADEAAIEVLEDEMEVIAERLEIEELDAPARAEAENQLATLGARLEEITARRPVIADELKPHAGTFLLLDSRGQVRLDAGYYAEVVQDAGEGTSVLHPDADGPANLATSRTALSQRLVDELAMQRRDILAVHVAADPGLALDLAIFLMVGREPAARFERSGSTLSAAAPNDPVLDFQTPANSATIARQESADALERSWTEGETLAERFDAFRTLPEQSRAAWLGWAVAKTLEASVGLPGDRCCAFHDHLGALLNIDVAQWWRPTGTNFFDRVPKTVTLAALAEIGGPVLAERYAKAKKVELAQSCERIFAGDFIAEADVQNAALTWVPEAMRFGSPPAAERAGEAVSPQATACSEDGDVSTNSAQIEEAA